MEFEALVPVARWWGFGSANDPQGPGFEAYTMGLDGVLLSWPRFEAGMREFRDVTLPLVRQAGLRDVAE